MGEAREVRCRRCGELLGADVGGAFLVDQLRVTSPFRYACRRCGFRGRWGPAGGRRPAAPEGEDPGEGRHESPA